MTVAEVVDRIEDLRFEEEPIGRGGCLVMLWEFNGMSFGQLWGYKPTVGDVADYLKNWAEEMAKEETRYG